MNKVTIRGLMRVHNKNRRAQAEQQRELSHLRRRAYRGIETQGSPSGEEVHGTFVYRGQTYSK